MQNGSRNALHVLRLVLHERPALKHRLASTAALVRDADTPSLSSSSSSSSATASTSSSPFTVERPDTLQSQLLHNPSFLESESDEYATASLLLPNRQFDPEPIPWPTLFPHENTLPPQSRFCDPIYRLVAQARYKDALMIYQEILSHNQRVQMSKLGHSIRIQHRHDYLNPALEAFKMGDHKTALLWLNVYPNRPPTSNHPGLKTVWEPVIDLFVNVNGSYRHDPEFLEAFLILMGRKGLLPTLLPPLLPHLTFAFPPEHSKKILENAINTYWKFTTSGISETERAKYQEEVVRSQDVRWWGSYLRKLIIAGWKDEARHLVENKPMQGEWDEITQKIINEELEDITVERVSTLHLNDSTDMVKRIRAALSDLPTPTEMSTLIRALSHPLITHEHPTLLERFKSRFTHPPSLHRARKYPTVKSRIWLHAEMLNLQRDGSHDEVVQLFRENFIWAGLPDHFKLKQIQTSISKTQEKSYPTIQVITSLIPSLLYTLPLPRYRPIQSFHAHYIDSSLSYPPSLRPNATTHATFLRELTHHGGSLAGLRALRRMTEAGIVPEEQGYAAVLYALAGRRQTLKLWALLSQIETQGVVGQRTYRGLVAILIKTGFTEDAEKIFWRARQKLGREDVFDGLELD
ncbi:uncharacterized protein IL334_006994 [Kwoniella shivajii]|uniref:Pentatricopeptide repeat domain-containing protein n=1 Tax=Kwoniella shivajii TaxID=564305 RepID=A0ABZ1D7H4_9TREE|nr:hypothetical protein IL334_006994 [Kwoniella shivajii]